MSTDVQVSIKVDAGPDKQSRRRSKDSEKAHRRSSNFQNKKYKHDHKFRKRSQSFNSSNGKFFPPYKMRKKDFIIPPTKFLLGGNITDPLNLNSLQDEEINRAMNAVTPKSSPLPTPRHRRGEIEVIIPPDITDPLNLIAGDDDATYEAMLTSPIKRTHQKKQKKNKKRRSNRSSSGPGSGKEDSIEGAKLDQTDPSPAKEVSSESKEELTDAKCEAEAVTLAKDTPQGPPQKRHKPDGNNRASLRKMELKERKADMDKIVSPVIPQPGAWNDRHRFRPPPQRTLQLNKAQAMPKFKENNTKFQYGNYNRYYGYRNPNKCADMRYKVLERQRNLFRGKDVLDIGCNTGHLTLAIARDFGPRRVMGIDIDRTLIDIARTNIRHYVNCGKKDKFFPVSMPIVYGPIDVPGVSEDKAFPNNVSFVQGNYVLESDVQLAMEQPQFDVIMCLSLTKWLQLNWGDAGLKRAFKRMFAQLRPGGVLVLEAQAWTSYKRKKTLTPEIWKNYHSIELFPHQFSQYLLSEVGFSKCEVIGSPFNQSRGFQRPIKLFIKEDPSFDTPIYSGSTSTYGSATPRYYRDTPGPVQHFANNLERYSFRLPDSVHLPLDEFSGDGSFPYGTPSDYNSPESGFSEGLHHPRRYPPRVGPMEEASLEAGSSQQQRESQPDTASTSEELKLPSDMKYGLLEEDESTLLSTDSNHEVVDCTVVNVDRIDSKEKEQMEIEDAADKNQTCEKPECVEVKEIDKTLVEIYADSDESSVFKNSEEMAQADGNVDRTDSKEKQVENAIDKNETYKSTENCLDETRDITDTITNKDSSENIDRAASCADEYLDITDSKEKEKIEGEEDENNQTYETPEIH